MARRIGRPVSLLLMHVKDISKKAIKNWDNHLAEHLAAAGNQDIIMLQIKEVNDKLNESSHDADINKSTEAMSDIGWRISTYEYPEAALELETFCKQLTTSKSV